MEAIKCLRSLRSTRQFRDEPVPDNVLRDMLESARWTGSSRNSQPWQFLVVRDRATLRRLAEAVPYGKHLAGAALGIAVAIEGAGRGQSLDAGRVAERILLAAHAHGVGSCLSTISDEEHERQARAVLDVPERYSLRVFISLGYPMPKDPHASPPPNAGRKPLEELVHYERFGGRGA